MGLKLDFMFFLFRGVVWSKIKDGVVGAISVRINGSLILGLGLLSLILDERGICGFGFCGWEICGNLSYADLGFVSEKVGVVTVNLCWCCCCWGVVGVSAVVVEERGFWEK